MEIGEEFVELRVQPLHTPNQLVRADIIVLHQCRPRRHQSCAMYRVFEMLRPRPRPQRGIVQRNRLISGPAEHLSSKPSVPDRKGRAEVSSIVRGWRGIDELERIPRPALLAY